MKRLGFEIVNDNIYKILRAKGYINGEHYWTFGRPQKHWIVETTREDRNAILEALKEHYNVIENDEWCGGNRLGIIVENYYEEVEL